MIFDFPYPEYFDLDTADIWKSEREYFLSVEKNIELARTIIFEIQSVLIENTDANFGIELYDNGNDEQKDYYSRNIRQYLDNLNNNEKIFYLDYFFHLNDCYSYNNSYIIKKDQIDDVKFQFFFALKLRQYQYSLINVVKFLSYQKRENFKNNFKALSDFLILVFKQYSTLFSEELTDTVYRYLRRKGQRPFKSGEVRSFLLHGYKKYEEECFLKNINELTETLSLLKREGFVHPATNLDQFKNIFSYKTINPEEKIIWVGSNIELKWFVQILLRELKVIGHPSEGLWKVTLHCFVDEEGNDFEKEETISKARGNLSQRRDLLKNILSRLTSTLPKT